MMNRNEKDNRDVQEILINYELEIKMVREIEQKRMAPRKSDYSNETSRKRKLTEVL